MTITAPKRARSGLALVLAAAFALVLLVGGPSGAAPQDANFAVQSGSLSVGASTFTLDPADGGGFTGTYDDETGALTGTLLLPPIVTELDVTNPPVGIVDVVITITQDGPGTGSIDPETGAATFDATVTLGIAASLAGSPVTPEGCRITPVDLTFEGTYDADTMVLSLSDQGFVLPPSTGCEAAGPLIDGALTGETSAVLELVSTDEPIVPPTTTTTTTEATTTTTQPSGAGPARPITTTARFTG